MADDHFHIFSGIGTVLVGAGILGLVFYVDSQESRAAPAPRDPFANMQVIDAALAQATKEKPKQPQKEFKTPPPPEKPVGVSHDENLKPKPPDKKDEPKAKPDEDPLAKFRRHDDDDDEDKPAGKPTIETGRIDGVEVGFGDKTFGDPYIGELKSALLKGWEYPEILSDVGTPIGCVYLKDDGSIDDVKLMQSSNNGDLDDSVDRALKDLKKKRNADPKPLPADGHLNYLTRIPLCWRMAVKSTQ